MRVEPPGAKAAPPKPRRFLAEPAAFTVTARLPRVAPLRAKVKLTAPKTAPAAGCLDHQVGVEFLNVPDVHTSESVLMPFRPGCGQFLRIMSSSRARS